jgi:hypothetical protein
MKIGATTKFYNLEMRRRRHELRMSQRELGRLARCTTEDVNVVENLGRPYGHFHCVREKLKRLAVALDAEFSLLYPPDYLAALEAGLFPKYKPSVIHWQREVYLAELRANHPLLLAEPFEDVICEADNKRSLTEMVTELVQSLPKRERLVLISRFGLDGGQPRTLRDIAEEYGTSPTRIQQIEAKALRKLRHPLRTRPLYEFMYGEPYRPALPA